MGVKILNIKDLETKQFSLLNLFKAGDESMLSAHVKLDLQVSNSNLLIAFSPVTVDCKLTIKLMEVDLAGK